MADPAVAPPDPGLAPGDAGFDLWPQERLRQATGLSDEALSRAVRAGRLIAVTTTAPGGSPSPPLFPSFFADPRFDRSQLEAVTAALGARPAPEKLFWFCRRSAVLGGLTPLAALGAGEVDAVLSLAASLAHPLPLRQRPQAVTVADAATAAHGG